MQTGGGPAIPDTPSRPEIEFIAPHISVTVTNPVDSNARALLAAERTRLLVTAESLEPMDSEVTVTDNMVADAINTSLASPPLTQSITTASISPVDSPIIFSHTSQIQDSAADISADGTCKLPFTTF